ncbi:MAG TPA: SIMPL domain-containing protein [Verrucomicrobiae bacterium]|nr:SIMPL domain-containing protein [Verrucomicrobiae bacterium]
MGNLGGVALAIAVAASGWWLADGLLKFRSADRYVTVKGLAEREVPADLVVWPITFTQTGNDLPALYEQIQANGQRIGAFLKSQGLEGAEQGLSTPRIEDFDAQGYRENRAGNRYKADVTYTVRSPDVPTVIKAMRASGELVKAGVALAPWGPAPEFQYTQLTELKPALLAQATENARRAAEQFAQDSASRVGRIRTANQGQINIADRDAGTPQVKAIRVVTTVEYELVDD